MKFLHIPLIVFSCLSLFSSRLHSTDLASSQSAREALVTALEQIEQLPTAPEAQEAFLQTHFPIVATAYCDALNVLSPYHQDKIAGSSEVIEGIISVSFGSDGFNHYVVVTGKEGVVIGYLQHDSLQESKNVPSSQEAPTAITHELSNNDTQLLGSSPSEGISNNSQETSSSLQNGINWCEQHPGAVATLTGACVMVGIAVTCPAALPAAQGCLQTAISLEWLGCLFQALFS